MFLIHNNQSQIPKRQKDRRTDSEYQLKKFRRYIASATIQRAYYPTYRNDKFRYGHRKPVATVLRSVRLKRSRAAYTTPAVPDSDIPVSDEYIPPFSRKRSPLATKHKPFSRKKSRMRPKAPCCSALRLPRTSSGVSSPPNRLIFLSSTFKIRSVTQSFECTADCPVNATTPLFRFSLPLSPSAKHSYWPGAL